MPLDLHRAYDYRRSQDQALLTEHLASWPAVRAAGQLPFVLKYGVLASALRITATLAVFTIAALLVNPRSSISIPSLLGFLCLLWLVGLAIIGTRHGLRLWRWQERLYDYAVRERARETEGAMAQQNAALDQPWGMTLSTDGRVHLYVDPGNEEPKHGSTAPGT